MTNNFENYTKQELITAIEDLDYFFKSTKIDVAERLSNRLLHNRTQTELARNSQLVDEESAAFKAWLAWVEKTSIRTDITPQEFMQGQELYNKLKTAQKKYQANQKVVNDLIMQGGVAK